ncbi:MAG: lipoprotein [Pseudolabrys sp.]|nr:lipoprotein [Pseudolabrys sp.]MBV9954492.1 lipoprotein [Pseudolabrys sp.]
MLMTRPIHAVVLIVALAGAMTLGGCGRKGPLDPPPVSNAAPAGPSASVEPGPVSGVPGNEAEQIPPVQGQKKRILLDGLLN